MAANHPNPANIRTDQPPASVAGPPPPPSGVQLGRIFGIPIYLHPSWFIIFALITLHVAHPIYLAAPRLDFATALDARHRH